MKRDQGLRTLALVVFFLSGISGLIYQVVWTKLLGLTMGNSMLSITTVVTAFMGGLALGSFFAGRLSDRIKSPFLVFGILEGLVGIYCLIIPSIIDATEPLMQSIYQSLGPQFLTFRVVQFLIAGGVLLFPTTLMGATLPVLSKHVTARFDRVGWSVGRLYAINTFGAVVGAFATGFVFIPNLGLSRTIFLGVSINLAIAVVVIGCWMFTRKSQASRTASVKDDQVPQPLPDEEEVATGGATNPLTRLALWSVLLCFFVSGFAAMGFQIGWTRVLSLVFGPSVYNFTLTVTTFILGLALGAIIFARFVDRTRDLFLLLAGCQFLIGLSGLFVMKMFGDLPVDLLDLYLAADQFSFGMFQFAQFRRAFILMLVPTILMGAVFPIAAKILARDLRQVGRAVGNAYSVNTVGSILGSFLTGFVLIPVLGIQGALYFSVFLYLAVGILLLGISLAQNGFRFRFVPVCLLAPAFLLALIVPKWDSEILGSGVYLYAQRHKDVLREDPGKIREIMLGDTELLYYEEGITTTVSIRKAEGGLVYMKTSGKTDASSAEDMYTQILCGHIPMMLHPAPKEICVIGLGSGVTLGSASLYEELEWADCIEISEEVVTGAGYFSHVNHNSLAQPDRLNILVEDGRNFLKMSGKKYDTILSEPSNPWIAGIGSLFTEEFFQACKDSLKPGGIMTQWANTYNMGTDEFRSVLGTFQSVFPNSMVWECVLGADYLLVGLPEDMDTIDYDRVVRMFQNEEIAADLLRIGLTGPPEFFKHFVFGPDAMKRFVGDVPIHTDDDTFLEYILPRNLYLTPQMKDQNYVRFLSAVQKERSTVQPYLRVGELDDDAQKKLGERLQELFKSRQLAMEGWIELCGRRGFEKALTSFRQSLELDSSDGDTRRSLSDLLVEIGKRMVNDDSQVGLSLSLFKEAAKIRPDHPSASQYADQTGVYAAKRLFEQEQYDLAFVEFLDVWKRNPSNLEAILGLCSIHQERENYTEAIRLLQLALRRYPEDPELYSRRGSVGFLLGGTDGAVADWQKSVSLDPENVRYRNNLAAGLVRLSRFEEAIIQYRRIQDLDPDYPQAYVGMGQLFMETGELDQASLAFGTALKLDPQMKGAGTLVYTLVATDAKRGDLDRAFHWLDQVIRLNLAAPGAIRSDPAMDPLKSDPRFEEVLSRWVASSASPVTGS